MAMSQRAVRSLASDHFQAWQRSTNKAKMLDLWARGEYHREEFKGEYLPSIPDSANQEMTELRDVSPTPWGRLIIGAVSQALAVTNHRNTDGNAESTKTFNETWKINSMMSRQGAIYRSALGQNISYISTLPAKRPHTGLPTVRMRGVPATKMAAFYDEEGEDDFARFAMQGDLQVVEGDEKIMLRVYDEERTYHLSCNLDGSEMKYITHDVHDVGVTPIHRFSPQLDLEGRAMGEIQPFIPLLRRLDQDVFDRLVVQRFNSWRVRYIAGMAKPGTPEEEKAAAMMLRVTDLLVSPDKDTKFGTLDGSDIKPYVDAHDADVKDLAAVSQTPPHHLLGQMANLSAEALAAAEASLMRKVDEYKLSFGQTWDHALRSAAFILAKEYGEEYTREALDYNTEVRWKDSESRSLSQAADALGKIADQLNVPVEMLWEQLPFWKKEDTARAKQMLQDAGADAMMMQFLDTMAGSANNPVNETVDAG